MEIVGPILVAFVVTISLMIALRPLAIATGLVAKPGGRRMHVGDVPVIGGLAMYCGMFCGFMLIGEQSFFVPSLLLAGALLVLTGMLDDRYTLPATARLLSQSGAVLIMFYGAGLVINDLGNPLWIGTIQLGPLALLGTLLIALTVFNAFNFVDGMDGLAGMQATIALTSIAIIGGLEHLSTNVSLISAAAVLGFLIFNLPIGKISSRRAFMGDAGSTLLGLTIVWTTIGVSQGEFRQLSPSAGLLIAAIPLYDLFNCFVRRVLTGTSPFMAGRDHGHHRLQSAGISNREILCLFTTLGLIYASIGVVGTLIGLHDGVLWATWAVLGIGHYWILDQYVSIRRRLVHQRKAAGIS